MSTTDDLFDAIDGGATDRIDELLGAEPTLADVQVGGIGVLRAAAYAGRADVASHLRAHGVTPDPFDAAALGCTDELRALLDADPALVHAVAGDGFTALHLAAWFGHDRTAELLLARGADPRARAANDTELEPLCSAAAGGHTVIAHLLLDRGAEVDAPQAGGVAPLHSAAHRGDAAMVALLLGRGADPQLPTADGRTPAELATDPEVIALLR